ncbi:MAG: PilZ domain-containing protein [Pseudomonadales bacterium]|jgi:hypothetical protein
MERRANRRKLTSTRVFLHHPELAGSQCTTRDLSAGGVFVLTAHAHRIAPRTVMKMTFAVDLGNLTRLYDFLVTVARVTDEGIGFIIDRSRPARTRAVPRRAGPHDAGDVLPLKR